MIPENLLQGDTIATTIAISHMDTIPDEWENDDANTKLKYRNTISCNFLGIIDDLVGFSHEGVNSIKMNAFVNAKTSEKNL